MELLGLLFASAPELFGLDPPPTNFSLLAGPSRAPLGDPIEQGARVAAGAGGPEHARGPEPEGAFVVLWLHRTVDRQDQLDARRLALAAQLLGGREHADAERHGVMITAAQPLGRVVQRRRYVDDRAGVLEPGPQRCCGRTGSEDEDLDVHLGCTQDAPPDGQPRRRDDPLRPASAARAGA